MNKLKVDGREEFQLVIRLLRSCFDDFEWSKEAWIQFTLVHLITLAAATRTLFVIRTSFGSDSVIQTKTECSQNRVFPDFVEFCVNIFDLAFDPSRY
jgi:hypothetical protein